MIGEQFTTIANFYQKPQIGAILHNGINSLMRKQPITHGTVISNLRTNLLSK